MSRPASPLASAPTPARSLSSALRSRLPAIAVGFAVVVVALNVIVAASVRA